MLQLTDAQQTKLGDGVYLGKMRRFLNDKFPETKEVSNAELDMGIRFLTGKAFIYHITVERDLGAYVVCGWVMGLDFDEKFPTIKDVLEDFSISSSDKAEFLWRFMDKTFEILGE
jgi:hypothetical protein